MTCPCCSRPRLINPPIIGIQYLFDEPKLILFNCECRTTLAIPWAKSTRAQRVDAFLADLARQAKN